MQSNIPATQALKCFAAAASHLSISKAAAQLCVTQGAVSKQVKQLETLLGVALFIRGPKGLLLTEQGEQYFDAVTSALSILSSSAESLQSQPRQQRLLIDVIPSMSHIWLIPRIHSFEKRFPHLQIDLISGDGQVNFNQTQADLSVRCLTASSAPNDAIGLFPERLLLVGAPNLLKMSNIKQLKDLLGLKLLQQNTRHQMWQQFFAQQHFEFSASSLNIGIGFQHFFMSLKAAKEGLGLALVPDFLARQDIIDGKLINPLQLQMSSEYQYYLLSPSYKCQLSKVQLFSQWLREEMTV
ncbi:MAG: LysR family transcriptional regulator [Oceanospirillaceae bacterium]|nr:LysR family transcriptional regulator [Oceanospirillaceae bacterium]